MPLNLTRMTEKQTVLLQIAVLIALTLLAYLEVRHHYFVWDTIPFVLKNPWIHELNANNLTSIFTEAHRANWHPVVLLSHALDFSVFGDDAGKHHLTNLALHCINVLLLYWLVVNLLTRFHQSSGFSIWVAFLTALIFALHPQHVESVAWVVERKDVLYTAFALASLLTYLRLNTLANAKFRDHAWPFLFFCLSISAKPMAVTIPVVMLILDIAPLNRVRNLNSLFMLGVEKLHYIALSAVIVLVTLSTQSEAMPGTAKLPVWASTLNAIDNSWFYVTHYFWPIKLSPFYPYPQEVSYLASWRFWLPGSAFLTVMTVSTLVLLKRGYTWPFLLFAFYIVTLLPVSGLIHVGPAKGMDHYVYLATVPLSLLTALAIVAAWIRLGVSRLVATIFSVTYISFLLLITQVQVSVWNNPLSLWTRVTELYPSDPYGHRNLAASYVQIGNWDLALQHAELSLKLGSPDEAYVIKLRTEYERLKVDKDNSEPNR